MDGSPLNIGLVAAAWLVGVTGGVHCVAMCGGLLAATGARDAARSDVLRPARAIARNQAAYHGGRIATYAMLGALFGTAGAQAQAAVDVLSVQRAVQIAANVFLLALAGSLVWRTGTLSVLQRAGSAAFAPLLRALRPLLQGDDLRGRVAMGLAWGLMPCALIYSVLPLALFAGGAWQGAAVMLGFGVGTLPNLLAGGVLLASARRFVSARTLRIAAAALLAAFGVAGIVRAIVASGALAQGLFCVFP
jgi:sulfite exporter TauE/SafE